MENRQETPIQMEAHGVLLEGLLTSPIKDRAAIITHPHPQYGGDMHNPVVERITDAYRSRGWATLRFNFRGTGSSQGAFENGKGEQHDIDAAIAWLTKSGAREIEMAGYSFGAWVISLWTQGNGDHNHAIRLVAPPVAFMDYGDIERIAGLEQIIVGGRDEFAPAADVEKRLQSWQPRAKLRIIENADHFFWNHMPELQAALESSIPG